MRLSEKSIFLIEGTRDELAKVTDWVNSTKGVSKYSYAGWEDSDPHWILNFYNDEIKAQFILEFG